MRVSNLRHSLSVLLLLGLLVQVLLGAVPSALAQGPADELKPFASYKEPPVQGQPQVAQAPIAPDLSNVSIPFVLTDPQQKRLATNGFVVSPGMDKEFFTLYEQGRYNYQPLFVTSDSLLHVYHLMFDKTLRTAESKEFAPLLRQMTSARPPRRRRITPSSAGLRRKTPPAELWAYFVVAGKLLDDSASVPADVADLVDGELKNIDAASGILPSPIFPGLEFGEDYTQYVPRGHYTKTETLQRYFKAMMWYGRMTFRLTTKDPKVGESETRMALLVAQAVRAVRVGEPYRPGGLE